MNKSKKLTSLNMKKFRCQYRFFLSERKELNSQIADFISSHSGKSGSRNTRVHKWASELREQIRQTEKIVKTTKQKHTFKHHYFVHKNESLKTIPDAFLATEFHPATA